VGQLTIYEVLTQEAIERAEANANELWKQRIREVIIDLARSRRMFTADDIWAAMGGAKESTHEPRALGALILRAIKDGSIASTGQYRKSTRRACHSRPIPIYVSRLV